MDPVTANSRLIDRIAVLLTGFTGVATVAATLLFGDQLPLSRSLSRALGFPILYAGMMLFLWAAIHLRSAIGGGVAPRLDKLVVAGPFRFVRHPVYVGMTVAMIGAGIVTRSVIGLVVAVLLFVPAEVHRARLEERALDEKFGDVWKVYAARTGFFLPRIGRRCT